MSSLGFKKYLGAAAVFVVLLLISPVVSALDAPPAPPLDKPVVDQTNTLSSDQISALAAIINEERTQTSNQIAILMIPTLAGDSLEDYSLRVARGWGIGEKDKNNGVLLLVVKNDRKLRIEVGYGLEGALPDVRAGQIIRDRITPEFREGKYYEGINSGLQGIITAIHGEYDQQLKPANANEDSFSAFEWADAIFVLLFIPLWLSSILARTKSWWAGGLLGVAIGAVIGIFAGFVFAGLMAIIGLGLLGALFDWFVSRNFNLRKSRGESPSWWAGGTHLGGSGGGGSFGGGSFGGGGSSGSW